MLRPSGPALEPLGAAFKSKELSVSSAPKITAVSAVHNRRMARRALLAGASAFAMMLAAGDAAHARSLNGSGSGVLSATGLASDAATQAAQQAAAVAAQTQQSLARAAKAVQDMQAVQAAARAAAVAQPSSMTVPVAVPNGLGAGGLLPNMPAGWSGANAPTQSVDGTGQTQVDIRQTTSSAILNWTSFNVGARTTLTFDQQGNSSWVALNRVNAATGPSQILGNIKADGQIYVINQSGIVFGGNSQINVGSLIASTADMVDPTTIYSAQVGGNYVPSFAGAGDGGTGSIAGKIFVEAGAQIATSAPAAVTAGGGFVLLLGSEVSNAGSITTPKGQVALAAGHDFILRPGLGTDSNAFSTTRGSEIAAGTWSGAAGSSGTWLSGGGTVTNSGIAFAQQGDITLTGHTVVQDGIVLSTTSVNQRGTIHLLNSASDSTGSVTLTGNALSAILPELDSTDTALNSQRDALIADSAVQDIARNASGNVSARFDNLSTLADREDESRIEIVTGGTVNFESGSYTAAQGGQIAVSAIQRIFTESGATLDVSGVRDVALAMESNNVEVNLQGNELRDSPQNRDSGVLLNNDVWIDLRTLTLVPAGTGGYGSDRYYTPGGLVEASGYVANTAHTIGEWASVGGSIMLSAPTVVTQQGSIFNLSGGSLDYAGGYIRSTNIVGSDGRTYSVDDAPADLTYVGFAGGFSRTHNVQGVPDASLTEIWTTVFDRGRTSLRWEDGYTVGRDAGSLTVSAPTAVLEGTIVDDVVNGTTQTQARSAGTNDGYKLGQTQVALAGQLNIGKYNSMGLAGAYASDVVIGDIAGITAGMMATSVVAPDRVNTIWLDASALDSYSLGGLGIASAGNIAIKAPLDFAPGAQVRLTAPNVDIAANITAPSGSFTATNILAMPTESVNLLDSNSQSQLTLRSGATIDVSGLWSNNAISGPDVAALGFLNGGNVTLDSTYSTTLESGSTINVSSGGAILFGGKTQGGTGGNVTLIAGDTNGTGVVADGATLEIDGAIKGYGVNGGGTLTINSPGTLVIGDNAVLLSGIVPAGTSVPVAVKLSSALTIPPGTPLPAPLVTTFTTITFDTPTTVPIQLGAAPTTPLAAPWTLPPGIGVYDTGFTFYSNGQTVPAGKTLWFYIGSTTLPVGTVIPSAPFPNGLPIIAYTSTVAAGATLSTPAVYPVGTLFIAGTIFPVSASIVPAQTIANSLFSTGFSNYAVNGGSNLLVDANVAIAPTVPVYQFTASSFGVPSGSDSASALSLWTPPLFTENPRTATLTQRVGASISLQSSTVTGASGGALIVSDGASITVDPGQTINLSAFGQITVLGDLTARSGNISITNTADTSIALAARNFDANGNGLGVSVWVGPNATLDVSGLAATANDLYGRSYGQVMGGGSISITGGNAFVMTRPGAQLVADGAQTVIDLSAGSSGWSTASPVALASDGGAISLSSSSGLYLDADMHAFAGGAGASGGSLAVSLITPEFSNRFAAPAYRVMVPSVLTLTEGYMPSLLPSDIAPGTDASSLKFGQGTISAERINAGGFGALSLSSGDFILFDTRAQSGGDISLALARSITLNAPYLVSGAEQVFSAGLPTQPFVSTSGSVTLAAPYIALTAPDVPNLDSANTGKIPGTSNPGGAPTSAVFIAEADQIDVQGPVHLGEGRTNFYDNILGYATDRFAPGFAVTELISQGDIRLLSGVVAVGNSTPANTTLASDWNIDLEGAQIYPATGTVAEVVAGTRSTAASVALPAGSEITLTIGRTTDTIPDVPMSVFGTLMLAAPVVEQGGIVRAPFGNISVGTVHAGNSINMTASQVDLLPGSLTSVSMDGVIIPYGGTIDGVNYSYNGTAVKQQSLLNESNGSVLSGVSLNGQSVNVQSGAVIDLSGGGTLAGAGFISGRGGSVDVLKTALVNANPANRVSKAGDKVYAIVPGYDAHYAPVAPENGAGDPVVGQQVTIPAGVPGLPAGTYTLLPSNYALLPGAYRVELAGSTRLPYAAPLAIGNGTYAASVVTGIANTAIQSSLPVTALITSGTAVRAYSQYNEQNYSDFLTANVAQFGGIRPLLPEDGKVLQFWFDAPTVSGASEKPALTFDGMALMQGAPGGGAGQVYIQSVDEISNTAPVAGYTGVSVLASEINAVDAPRLVVDGYMAIVNGVISFQGGRNLIIGDGVTLQAAEMFLVGGNVTLGNNVTLTTIGQGAVPFDSATTGLPYSAYATSVLALSNGELDFLGGAANGTITVGAGSQLYAEGTLALATNGTSSFSSSARFGARDIVLAVNSINIGSAADIAAAGNPSGLVFDQALFNTLLNGDPSHGAPALQTIALSASGAVNIFGNASLDATGTGVDLTLNAPAIYGYGAASDHAVIAADTITWNGVAGATPPVIAAGGAGTGLGTLDLVASQLNLGTFVSLDTTTANRTIYGFANVDLTGRTQIASAGNGGLFVYQVPSAVAGAVFGQSGTGGNLTLTTPLLTGVQKSIMAYTAGGALAVVAPSGIAPSAATTTVAGAEIDLSGDSVAIGTTVLLPSGKFVVNAVNGIALNDGSRIDLSGQVSTIQTAAIYGFGGTANFTSAQGDFIQSVGSSINVSATHNTAGSINIDARAGQADLNGVLAGAADDTGSSGAFSVLSGTMSDGAFAALNASLSQGGFFASRSFDIRTGNLSIGDGVKARDVSVSVDAGSLTVTGTIDASGDAPGTIRLSAGNGLTLASSALLDVHGNVLQVDSYGAPIEASNRGHIELTAAGGTLTLSPGARMDLTTPDGIAYGDVQINAQRTAETSGDIAINASRPLDIRGADSIALNAFWTYDLAGGSVITQTTLDGYDTASTAFMNAVAGSGLAARVTGLAAYGSIYHLRPGVQITSTGDLSTSGNIDLSMYRYGAGADRDANSAMYGAGEPMALVIRAGGNLKIGGSISDGFMPGTAATPAVYNPLDLTVGATLYTASGWGFPAGTPSGYYRASYLGNPTLTANWTVPNDAFYQNWYSDGYGPFRDINGNTYAIGQVIPAGTTLTGNLGFEQGAMPTAGTLVSAAKPALVVAGQMLAPGSLSASIRLVGGADLADADQRSLQTTQALNGGGNLTLNDATYTTALNASYISVVRTGTGDLDLLAGGSFSEASPYGVYTAGTQAAPIIVGGSNPYDVLGTATAGAAHTWYTESGGDVLLSAQQDITGYIQIADNVLRGKDSDLTGNWLVRQGGNGVTSDPTGWGINFGRFTATVSSNSNSQLVGFQGIGTLGGGNLTVVAGRNAGVANAASATISSGLDLVVASSGRVAADGSLLQTGGGDLSLTIGGVLNSVPATNRSTSVDYFGAITDLRGDITIDAGAIGTLAQATNAAIYASVDPRAAEPDVFKRSYMTFGPTVIPGDGTVSISTRGDLVLGGAADAGMGAVLDKNGLPYTAEGASTATSQGGQSAFMLWTVDTAISLYAAGGDVAPTTGGGSLNGAIQNPQGLFPATLHVTAANGDIRFYEPTINSMTMPVLELMPSPTGQLDLLAAGSIYGSGQVVAMSGADMSLLATPFQPVFSATNGVTNSSTNSAYRGSANSNPIAFGEDNAVSDLHADDSQPARVYAGIDIDDLTLGQVVTYKAPYSLIIPTHTTWYKVAKPFEVIAGRDIVGTGAVADVFLNNDANDISLLQAGRDIIYQTAVIAGPGLLQVQAGRNLYQGYRGSLTSVGDIVNPADTAGGAGITTLVGVGTAGPDYADFARLYFDPANQLPDDGTPLTGSGKVVKAYDKELLAWLQQRFGYTGTSADALAYFLSLPQTQQGVFVRQVYYEELTLGGREYNDTTSSRHLSYLRGREAIAALFPDQDQAGNPITYSGQLTMFSSVTGSSTVNGVSVPTVSDAGIHTQFGGDIQILNPGGQTIVGVEGVAAGANAGLVTQGQNSNIDIYSLGSVLLGQSRVMTTFGGDILVWSATGDINAGRGSKTSVTFTPPLRETDRFGNITLSPAAPASGAGIATLITVPGTRASDIDLIAPEGTIDAGEAGIRVSGNVNLAALQVLNAANIQVQGTATGIPTVQAPSISAALATNNATAASQQTATPNQGSGNERPSVIIVEVLGYGGGDSEDRRNERDERSRDRTDGYDPKDSVRVLGNGQFSREQTRDLTEEERAKLRKLSGNKEL